MYTGMYTACGHSHNFPQLEDSLGYLVTAQIDADARLAILTANT